MEYTFYSTDLSKWRTNMNSEAKEHRTRKGLSACQHKDLSFEESAVSRTDSEFGCRTFSKGLFTRSHVSGSIVERDWLCY